MTTLTTIKRIMGYCCLFVAITTLSNAKVHADVAVIVNPESGITALTAKEVKSLFLSKKSSFPHGIKAVPVDQVANSGSRKIFINKVLKKTEGKLTVYWARLVFSGKGSPPKTLDNDGAVKAFVAKTPGGIGYINTSIVDDSVTVVLSPLK